MSESTPEKLVASTWSKPFTPPASLPASTDVVIIGGGIIGVSTAWFLARQGVDVVVCEKGHIAGEQSGRNWGWVRQQGRDTRELPMAIESLRIWRRLAEDIGEDVGYSEDGCLFATNDDKELARYAEQAEIAKDFGLDTRVIDRDELKKLAHGASADWVGALYTPSDGRAEPHKATTAIARAAERHGATVLTSCAVRGLDIETGRVAGVVTEYGTIRTSKVLCAGGAWTSMFCRSLGIDVPQLKVRGTVARTAPSASVLDVNLYEQRLGIRRRQDGGYSVAHGFVMQHAITPSSFRFFFKFLPALKLEFASMRVSFGKEFFDELQTPRCWDLASESPFERTRVLNPEPNLKVLAGIRRSIDDIFPALASAEFAETWAGMIETTPDVIPVIDDSDKIPGFYIATGFSGHGFGIGPGAGKAIAGMLTGKETGIDLKPFRLSRFFDGSPIEIQSSI